MIYFDLTQTVTYVLTVDESYQQCRKEEGSPLSVRSVADMRIVELIVADATLTIKSGESARSAP